MVLKKRIKVFKWFVYIYILYNECNNCLTRGYSKKEEYNMLLKRNKMLEKYHNKSISYIICKKIKNIDINNLVLCDKIKKFTKLDMQWISAFKCSKV